MQITTDALVLKVMDVGENDRLLTLLSKDYGIIRAFASGAKKIQNKKYAATSFVCYSHFILKKVNDAYRVREADLITSFFKIGCDIVTITLQQYFCELATVLSPVETEGEDFLRLILNSLHHLNTDKLPSRILKPVFELRFLSLAGYMPDLVACNTCGNFEKDYYFFDYINGIITCKDCILEKGGKAVLDSTVLSAMRHIVYAELNKLFCFSIPADAADRLNKITENYLLHQTERKFHSLDFYRSIV